AGCNFKCRWLICSECMPNPRKLRNSRQFVKIAELPFARPVQGDRHFGQAGIAKWIQYEAPATDAGSDGQVVVEDWAFINAKTYRSVDADVSAKALKRHRAAPRDFMAAIG